MNSKIKMNMIWNIVQFPQILTSWVSPFILSQIQKIGQLFQAQMIKWSPSNLIRTKGITNK
jgi:hypothetical protein